MPPKAAKGTKANYAGGLVRGGSRIQATAVYDYDSNWDANGLRKTIPNAKIPIHDLGNRTLVDLPPYILGTNGHELTRTFTILHDLPWPFSLAVSLQEYSWGDDVTVVARIDGVRMYPYWVRSSGMPDPITGDPMRKSAARFLVHADMSHMDDHDRGMLAFWIVTLSKDRTSQISKATLYASKKTRVAAVVCEDLFKGRLSRFELARHLHLKEAIDAATKRLTGNPDEMYYGRTE